MDPYRKFASWFAQAKAAGKLTGRDPTAMVLATADRRGRPSARVVLFKGVQDGAIRFFTNYQSQKAKELDENPYASVVFHWPENGHQVRISGRVRRTSAAESDAYWESRPRESQIGAHASAQSRVMPSWARFLAGVREVHKRFRAKPVPRPDYWGGYHLIPDSFEFWANRANRLHQRLRLTSTGARTGTRKWKLDRLFP